MKLEQAQLRANELREQMLPYCHRIEIGGSIRREQKNVKDIELIMIPKTDVVIIKPQLSIFEAPVTKQVIVPELAEIINQYQSLKGNLAGGGKYQQIYLPAHNINADLFTASGQSFGYIMLLRTGSYLFNRYFVLPRLKQRGYFLANGKIYKNGVEVPVPVEEDVFRLLNVPYIRPDLRYMEDVKYYKLDKQLTSAA